MSFIESALTPAGTNARRSQENQQASIANQYADLFKSSVPLVQGQLDFAKSVQPQYNGALQSYIQSMTPQAVDADLARFNSKAFQTANNQARQQEMLLRSQGAGDSALKGVQQAAYNTATDQSLNAQRQAYSNEERMKRALAILQALQQAQNPQAVNILGALAQGVYGRPEVQVQSNPLGGVLGNVLSTFKGR